MARDRYPRAARLLGPLTCGFEGDRKKVRIATFHFWASWPGQPQILNCGKMGVPIVVNTPVHGHLGMSTDDPNVVRALAALGEICVCIHRSVYATDPTAHTRMCEYTCASSLITHT